jgi:hypothetical protein
MSKTARENGDMVGPAKDFMGFIDLELERRRNSDQAFDPALFEEAVDLVLAKLRRVDRDLTGG